MINGVYNPYKWHYNWVTAAITLKSQRWIFKSRPQHQNISQANWWTFSFNLLGTRMKKTCTRHGEADVLQIHRIWQGSGFWKKAYTLSITARHDIERRFPKWCHPPASIQNIYTFQSNSWNAAACPGYKLMMAGGASCEKVGTKLAPEVGPKTHLHPPLERQDHGWENETFKAVSFNPNLQRVVLEKWSTEFFES